MGVSPLADLENKQPLTYADLNSQFLRDYYLFGIPLEDMYGNKMKEGLLDHYLMAAIEYTQRTLQVTIKPTVIESEVHDYYSTDMTNWGFMQLHKRPVIEVTQLGMWYGVQQLYNIPQDWVRVYSIPGQIELFPMSGSAGSILITANGGLALPMMAGMYSNAPSMWRVTYRAGMETIPEDIAEFIMKRASVGILQVWGDLIIGAGIANQTISIDGLSQSIGTTQSPEFSGAGARIKNYMDDLKALETRLRDTYLGINMVVV